MKKLSERQMNVLMNLGRAVDEALVEFPGRTPADVSVGAHQAYSSMLGLAGRPAPTPAPARRKRRAKSKPKRAAKPASAAVPVKSDKAAKIVSVIQKAGEAIPASEIAVKLKMSGQGLGPTLNMLAENNEITKKTVDGMKLWGPKKSSLNGKANHAHVN